MKRILAALGVLLALAVPAHAQKTKAQMLTEIATNFPDNSIGAITPAILRATVTDIINSYVDLNASASFACASSRWVSSGTTAGFTCTQPSYADIANPTALTTNLALNITQSTPTSGTQAGPFTLNAINITDSIRVTGAGSDTTGNNNAGMTGFRINQFLTTANLAGTGAPIITALFTATVQTTSAITDVTGVAGTAYTNVAMSGAYLEGMNAVGHVGPTGSANILVGLDVGSFIEAGGTSTYRFGASFNSGGAVNGTTLDAAIVFNNNSATTKFTNIFSFSNFAGQAPIGAATKIFMADTAYSITSFADFNNVAISAWILNFPNMKISGAGGLSLGSAATAAAAASISMTGTISVDRNAAALQTVPTGTNMQIDGVDSTNNFFVMDGFGTGAGTVSLFTLRQARGTGGAKTAVQTGDQLGFFTMTGYDGTGYGAPTSTGVAFGGVAYQNWANGSAQGAGISFLTTPSSVNNGLTEAARIQDTGCISIGTVTQCAAGWLLANKAVQSTALTVATLPTCNAAAKGAHAFVTDSNSVTFHATVAAGGGNNVAVACDGTNWYID